VAGPLRAVHESLYARVSLHRTGLSILRLASAGVFFFFVLFTFFFPFCVPTVAQVQELQYHMKRASPTLSAFREHLQSLGRFLHSKKAFQSCHSPTSVSRTVHFITVMD
jgi:hypothetical protein